MKKLILFIISLGTLTLHGQDLIITGVIDGPLPGGTPKAIELYATADIADLSLYAIGSANNGGGTDGPEFTLSGSVLTGNYIYIASESIEFNNFFGFAPNLTSGDAIINGDDAIELFYDATGLFMGAESVIDVFGDINVDGTGQAWDYEDGWAYRNNATGPDGSTFIITNWSFSGANALDGESTNASATTPFPIGTYSPVVGDFTAPVWSPSFPYLDNLAATSFDIFGQIDEPGTIYYVVIPNGALAPSSAQVAAGSAPGATLFSGSIPVPAGLSTVSTSVTGLVEGLDYDVYVVAQDDEGTPNIQASPIKLNFPPELIAITEFMNNSLGTMPLDPSLGDETTNEWIELFNYGANAVDLTGWIISDEGADSDAIGSISINPGDFVIFSRSKVFFETQWLGGITDARVIELAITLADGADEIILSDSDGNPVWSLAYANDETEGDATYFGYSENSTSTIFGSGASPGVVRTGNDVTGTLGYEKTGDGLAYTSTNGDTGSPLDGAYGQPLPVELVSFDGNVNGQEATLLWQTMTEINNSGFQIEKSSDGINFLKVGFVKGNGNSNELISYSFSDRSFNSSFYYRLKQIDYNGVFEFSEIIFLENKRSTQRYIISPNPIEKNVDIHFQSNFFQLQIMDLAGKKLFEDYSDKQSAIKKILALEKGTYLIRLSNEEQSRKQVVIKE